MIRRSPCEVYIKYLLSHPDGRSVELVRSLVRSQQLDYPSDAYAKRLQSELIRPSTYIPYDKTHRPSAQFLRKHKLVGFYHPDRACAEAHRLLTLPRAKELIETMTIAGDGDAAIVFRLRGLGVHTQVEALQRYRTFYWDLELVDSTELRGLLNLRHEHMTWGSNVTDDDRMQKAALAKVTRKDPRKMAADMPISPMAGLFNQMRMGYMPSKIELARLAATARTAAVMRVAESTIEGGQYAAAAGRDWSIVAKEMTSLIKDIGDPDATLSKQLQTLAIETETTDVPHIKQLSGGNHTTDFGPRMVSGEPVKGVSDV